VKAFNGYKKCSCCGDVLPILMFSKNKREPDGLQCECRNCDAERSKKCYEANKARENERSRKWNESHKEEMKEHNRKNHARAKGYEDAVPLIDNPFEEEVEWHHINDRHVVAVPKDIHKCYVGKGYNRKIHQEMLQPIIEDLYSISFEELLS